METVPDLRAVRLDEASGELVILDQTLLPNEVKLLRLKDREAVWEAIHMLRVRGAPAIGMAAAFGAYAGALEIGADSYGDFLDRFLELTAYLATSRPTAVNLFHALERMEKRACAGVGKTVAEVKADLLAESKAIQAEDVAMCRAIGDNGLALLQRGWGLLTHCNAGQLAASRYGTALAPVYVGHEQGYGFKVFADETRPLLQGARLTAFELMAAGVDVTLLCDSSAQTVMRKGWVQAVLVGCDRVAANGDVANKVGTAGLAIMARHYGIPFYVLGPTSTIDMGCSAGADIVVEERGSEEVTELWYSKRMAPEGVKAFNPAFDVTDHGLISGIVTQHGVARAPFRESFERMLSGVF